MSDLDNTRNMLYICEQKIIEMEDIVITQDFLSYKFDEYNQMYFEGKLRKPHFKIHKGYPYGEFKNKPRKTICISSNVQWTESKFRDVMVHEMIHCWNCQVKHYESFHGKYFKEFKKHIYCTYGLKIHTTYHYLFKHEIPPQSIIPKWWWYIKRHFKISW